MSTRGYIGIKKKGQLKGMYNHWDSYPSGLGKNLVETINKIKVDDRLKVLNDTFDYIELVDESGKPNEEQIAKCIKAKVCDLDVSNRSYEDWYCLVREAQGNLQIYIDKTIPYMLNGNDFINDSLFCEWAYIINLDTNKFEVYTSGTHFEDEFDLLDLNLNDVLNLED